MNEQPMRWWQWILMYPTLLVAVVGAVPQYSQWITAVLYGLSPFANVSGAQEQLAAWQRNSQCLTGIDHIKPTSPINYEVDLLSCPSGDILVTLTPLRSAGDSVSRWIVTRDLFTKSAGNFLIAPAFAATGDATEGTAYSVRVLDIRQQGTTVVRRVQQSNNKCIDETIDALTGRHLSERAAPCTKF